MTNRAFFDQREPSYFHGLTPEMMGVLDQPEMQNQLAIAISLIEARVADAYLDYLALPKGDLGKDMCYSEFNTLCLALRTITGSKHNGFNFGNKDWAEQHQSDK